MLSDMHFKNIGQERVIRTNMGSVGKRILLDNPIIDSIEIKREEQLDRLAASLNGKLNQRSLTRVQNHLNNPDIKPSQIQKDIDDLTTAAHSLFGADKSTAWKLIDALNATRNSKD